MATSMELLYPIAERRGGYFTTAQAAEVGVSRQQLYYLARTGSLDRVAQGIYRLHRFPTQRFEDVIVACLWVGEDAAASHDTALAIYELTDAMPPRHPHHHAPTVPRPATECQDPHRTPGRQRADRAIRRTRHYGRAHDHRHARALRSRPRHPDRRAGPRTRPRHPTALHTALQTHGELGTTGQGGPSNQGR